MAIDTAAKRLSAISPGSPWRGPATLPDGTIGEDGRLSLAFLYGGIAAEAPVEVPDVVGLDEAAAIAAIEADGFVASGSSAYSDTVAVGDVISQSPTAGSFAASGSTVTYIVSLGAEARRPQGGGSPNKRKRRRTPSYTVEVDGEEFSVSSRAEAEAVLKKATEVAEEVAQQAVERAVKAQKRPIRRVMSDARRAMVEPVITAPIEFAEQVKALQAEIEAIYRDAMQKVEMAALLQRADEERRRMLDDDDDAVLLLLL